MRFTGCILAGSIVAFGVALAPGPAPAAEAESPLATVLAAGDIAWCGEPGAEATARLLDRLEGTVLALGDLAYPDGTAGQFRRCYGPTWGRHKARTRPVPGNHDYRTTGAEPYFAYFGRPAGRPGRGYYGFDLGGWHLVALDSNVDAGPGSEQERWLRADLAATGARCILAYWHHPPFSSGHHGDDPRTAALLRALHEAGASIVLSGHDHDYERFAPQDPDGRADPERGIRVFVVGTGGARRRGYGQAAANSEVFQSWSWGVLELGLYEDRYTWRFVPTDRGSFRDSGSARCVSRAD